MGQNPILREHHCLKRVKIWLEEYLCLDPNKIVKVVHRTKDRKWNHQHKTSFQESQCNKFI